MNEQKILSLMKNLKCSREEAISVLEEDAEIDKMKSMKELNADLTEEQIKASRAMRQTTAKVTKKTSPREKKTNEEKLKIISSLVENISENLKATKITTPNDEREIIFFLGDTKYKLVLSCPRS